MFHIIDLYLALFFLMCTFSCLTGQFTDPEFPGIYYFELEEKASLKCAIAFSPKEVSSTFYY